MFCTRRQVFKKLLQEHKPDCCMSEQHLCSEVGCSKITFLLLLTSLEKQLQSDRLATGSPLKGREKADCSAISTNCT